MFTQSDSQILDSTKNSGLLKVILFNKGGSWTPLCTRSSSFQSPGLVNDGVGRGSCKWITGSRSQSIHIGFIWYIGKERVQFFFKLLYWNLADLPDGWRETVEQFWTINLEWLIPQFSNTWGTFQWWDTDFSSPPFTIGNFKSTVWDQLFQYFPGVNDSVSL